MSLFMQLLANGLIAGSIYALVACGFSLIYTTNRFMHIAHGTTVALAGYLLFLFFTTLNVPFTLAIIISLLLCSLAGVLMYRLVYLPLENKKASTVILLIASVGLLLLIENLIQIGFGANVRVINAFPITKGLDILGAIITPLQLVVIGISFVLMILLYFFMQKTKLGRHMRAVADHRELASIVGINTKRVVYLSFAIGSFLAGIAGVLIALEQNLTPTMGTDLIIKGFTGAIVGGVTSVPASVLGGYILGLVENFGIWYLPSGYKDAIAFILLFLFLLLKPNGLFGIKRGERDGQ